MINVIDLALAPSEAKEEALVRERAAEFLNVASGEITHIRPVKRSVDARCSRPVVRLRLEGFVQ